MLVLNNDSPTREPLKTSKISSSEIQLTSGEFHFNLKQWIMLKSKLSYLEHKEI